MGPMEGAEFPSRGEEELDEAMALHPSIPKPLWEASYLTAPNADRYRIITHLFHLKYKLHQHRLKPREIVEHVRQVYDSEYTLDACVQDLEKLVEWGNLGREQDREAVGSIEEWRNRDYVYEVTPWTVRIERMLEEARSAPGPQGSLDSHLVEAIHANVEALDRTLRGLTPKQQADTEFVSKRIRVPWEDINRQFDALTEGADDYHHQLREAYKEDLGEIDAFLTYKEILLDNLEKFVNALVSTAQALRACTGRWRAMGAEDMLVGLLARSKNPTLTQPQGADQERRYRREVEVFVSWFQPGGGLDALKRTTGNAIHRVVHLTARRMERRRAGGLRRETLVRLAGAFAQAGSLEEAHVLAALTLGSPSTRHVHGAQAWGSLTHSASVWAQPSNEIPMRRIVRGRPPRARPEPVRRRGEAQVALLAAEERRRRQETVWWDKLFKEGPIVFRDLEVEDREMLDRLLEALDQCLMASDGRGVGSDGSTLRIVPPPNGAGEGVIRSPDGELHLPRFTLLRERRGEEVA